MGDWQAQKHTSAINSAEHLVNPIIRLAKLHGLTIKCNAMHIDGQGWHFLILIRTSHVPPLWIRANGRESGIGRYCQTTKTMAHLETVQAAQG